jgi:hypothetical protein
VSNLGELDSSPENYCSKQMELTLPGHHRLLPLAFSLAVW